MTESMMNAARYEAAPTFEQFLQSVVKYKELWESTTKRTQVPAAIVEEVTAITGQWHIVVIAEDWCIDAISTLPPIAALAELTTQIDMRVMGRETNPDLMHAHLTNGGRSIPVAILYDDSWQERAWWGPRPAPLQEWVVAVGRTLAKEVKYREIRGWYARDHGATTLREIADMLIRTGT
jgi:hypothetical protein